ncbi:MAG: creatininase family protein [Clostridium fessum]
MKCSISSCRQVFLSLYRHGARKFVFLNGHGGGNIKMIERLGMEFEDKGCLVAMLNWWLMAWDMNPAWKGGHGGGRRTAAILGIDPSLVDKERDRWRASVQASVRKPEDNRFPFR